MFKCEVCGSVEQDHVCPFPGRLPEERMTFFRAPLLPGESWHESAWVELLTEALRARASEAKLREALEDARVKMHEETARADFLDNASEPHDEEITMLKLRLQKSLGELDERIQRLEELTKKVRVDRYGNIIP